MLPLYVYIGGNLHSHRRTVDVSFQKLTGLWPVILGLRSGLVTFIMSSSELVTFCLVRDRSRVRDLRHVRVKFRVGDLPSGQG